MLVIIVVDFICLSRGLGIVSVKHSYKTCRDDGHERNGRNLRGKLFFFSVDREIGIFIGLCKMKEEIGDTR